MKGKELQQGIVDLGRTLGWRMAHFRSVPVKYPGQALRWQTPVAADGKGFPDLIAVRERIIAIEVKGSGDTLKPEQETWISALRLAGVECHVWGPADWGPDGPIETTLKLRRRRDRPYEPTAEEWGDAHGG